MGERRTLLRWRFSIHRTPEGSSAGSVLACTSSEALDDVSGFEGLEGIGARARIERRERESWFSGAFGRWERRSHLGAEASIVTVLVVVGEPRDGDPMTESTPPTQGRNHHGRRE